MSHCYSKSAAHSAPTLPAKDKNWNGQSLEVRSYKKAQRYYIRVEHSRTEPTQLSRAEQCKSGFTGCGARDRNRTGTSLSGPGILSPVRLPVSPPGHALIRCCK